MNKGENKREADLRRIDERIDERIVECCTRLGRVHGDVTSPRISMLEIVLLACCALHAIMLFLAIDADNLGWTVFGLLAMCLDIYSLGEIRL